MPAKNWVLMRWRQHPTDESDAAEDPRFDEVSLDDPLPVQQVYPQGYPTHTFTVQLQTDTAAYTAGDAVGNLIVLTGMARFPGAGGEIRSVVLIDDAAQGISGSLYLFNAPPITATANNAAFAPTDTDMRTCIGTIPVLSYPATAPTANTVATVRGAGLAYTCRPSGQDTDGTTLYGQFQTDGTPTYTANGITLRIVTVRD